MDLHNIFYFGSTLCPFSAAGSFGSTEAGGAHVEKTTEGYRATVGDLTITANLCEEGGILLRRDTLRNTGNAPITLNHYASRFVLQGGEYDVYTQLSMWQNESRGEWQPLVTEVSAASTTMYTASDGAPMLALFDRLGGRGVVFHLYPRSGWRIRAARQSISDRFFTVIDCELADPALAITLAPGESIEPSPVLYYRFRDRRSLDCHKLHAYLDRHHPRKSLPVLYNTWLAHFDKIDFDSLAAEVREAAALGCEYFTVDAGWFGEGASGWYSATGDWRENTSGALCGRMRELADLVRAQGMQFGLWMEPERAHPYAPIYQEHPEYFLPRPNNAGMCYLDFSNPAARDYILDVTCSLIERYGIRLLKFDFNSVFPYDPTHRAFYDYHRGHREYVATLRARCPGIYLECCAGGGKRMDLSSLALFDGVWFTDNQSPYAGLSLIAGSILRLPPAYLERWGVLDEADLLSIHTGKPAPHLLATDDAKWEGVVSTTTDYMRGFFAGGSPALSCNLTRLSEETKEKLREIIAEHKQNRDFYAHATCRVLASGEGVLCLQYSRGDDHRIVVYTQTTRTPAVTVYPELTGANYLINGNPRTGADLRENGITIPLGHQTAEIFAITPAK